MATRQQILDNLTDIPPMEIAEAISENVVTLYELSRTGKLMPRKKRLILEAYEAIKAGRLQGPENETPTTPAAEDFKHTGGGFMGVADSETSSVPTGAFKGTPDSETSSVPAGEPSGKPFIEQISEPATGPVMQSGPNEVDLPYDPFAPTYPGGMSKFVEPSYPTGPSIPGETTFREGPANQTFQPVYPPNQGYAPPSQPLHYAEKPAMFQNPFSFSGRIRRTEYGLCYALYLFGVIALRICLEAYASVNGKDDLLLVVVLTVGMLMIPLFWLILAQSVKRCHDLGASGWCILIPLYNPFALLFGAGNQGPNKYGPPAK